MNLLPIFGTGQFPLALEFIPALIIGFGFGFVLERSGFGRASVLVAQFYGHDMRVFKVMFTAIVTAMIGVAIASGAGVVDLKAIYVPETFLFAHLVGGFVLGVGFIVSGYCPGTSIVGFASSKWDGLVTIAGVVVGSVLFGELYPLVKPLYLAQAKGVLTFSDLLGLRFEVLAAAVALFAVALFAIAEKAEGYFSRRRALEAPNTMTPVAKGALGTLIALALASTAFLLVPQDSDAGRRPKVHVTRIDAAALAKRLIERPRGIMLVDLRGPEACKAKRIPLAYCFDQIAAQIENLPSNRPLVVYGHSGTKHLPKQLSRFTGKVYRLDGGYQSWSEHVLRKPDPKLSPADYRLRLAVHSHFTGQTMQRPAPVVRPTVIRRKSKKGGGCL
ncbi:MAG: YeeE/YedE family protein [Myxococcales bacterium]|nr:YeeE/YedE family protein [Myxococcales bacterium]